MKYSMVKQFSNAAVDNVFNFGFKIFDFGKIMIEVFWAFFEIWSAFFLIFYNIFMYIYYIFLFIVDRGSESGGPTTRRARRTHQKRSKMPTVIKTTGPNPIPAMYRVREKTEETARTISSAAASVASATAGTAKKAISPGKPAQSKAGSKKNYIKIILEFISDLLKTIADMIMKPFRAAGNFFSGRLKPVKEGESSFKESGRNTSLIDEYMKEYQKKKK